MAAKTYDERIANIDQKLHRLQQDRQALQRQKAEKERKERTRRLIEIGAILEKTTGRSYGTIDQRKNLQYVLEQGIGQEIQIALDKLDSGWYHN